MLSAGVDNETSTDIEVQKFSALSIFSVVSVGSCEQDKIFIRYVKVT